MTMLRRLAALAAAGLLVAALGGCGGGKADYGKATQGTFLASCNPGADPSRDAVCRCAYDRLSKKYTYDQFVDLDKSLAGDPKAVPKDVLALVTACAVEVSEASSSSSAGSSSDRTDASSSR